MGKTQTLITSDFIIQLEETNLKGCIKWFINNANSNQIITKENRRQFQKNSIKHSIDQNGSK